MKPLVALASAVVCCSLFAFARGDDRPGEGWIDLFDGKSLKGWKANEHPENWSVKDGAIVTSGPRSHLFYVGDNEQHPAEFQDFHLKAEVMTRPKANSGLYFHTKYQPDGWPEIGYECQVNTSHGDPVKTASLYNTVKNLTPPAKDNEWFTLEVIVQGKHITTKVNGKTIVDYVEPDDVKGGRKLSRGTFALQAHDPGSSVSYRKIQVQRLSGKN